MKTPMATVEQIRSLMSQAAQANDTRTFNACARALDGSARATKLVSKIVADNRAEAVHQEMLALAVQRAKQG